MQQYAMMYDTEEIDDHIDFPDGTGPRADAFETLRVELRPQILNAGGPFAPEDTVLLTLEVYGIDLSGDQVVFRSIPPSRIGAV